MSHPSTDKQQTSLLAFGANGVHAAWDATAPDKPSLTPTLETLPLIKFAVGIKEGGRTGVTAFVLGCGFVIAMFFSPLFSSIPGYATGPALIVVGA